MRGERLFSGPNLASARLGGQDWGQAMSHWRFVPCTRDHRLLKSVCRSAVPIRPGTILRPPRGGMSAVTDSEVDSLHGASRPGLVLVGYADPKIPPARGGGKGIRTLEGLAPLAVFKTAAFVRSAIPPGRV
jgi:hypothetical protein